MGMKSYRLEIPPLVRFMPFVWLGFLTIGLPVFVLTSHGPIFILAPFFAFLAWTWWVLLTIAYRVVIHDDGSLEWIALIRRVKTLPEDVREIRPDRIGSIGFLVVKYAGGKIRFINQITGFHEVLVHIKNRNPLVILKGC
jgi:hypothetical protein